MNKGDFIISSGFGSSSNLKDYYEQYEIYQLIASGTTGTIEVPKIGGGTIDASKYSIKMDGYSGGLDALCLKTSGGKPIDDLAQTSSSSYITTSLSGEYNRTYNLSDTPSVYPVALSFLVTMSLEDAKYLNFDYVLSREIDTSGFEFISNKKTTLAENSDTFYPTQKAVKTAVDGKVSKITSVDKRLATFNLTDGEIQDDSLLKVSQGKIYPTTDGTTAIQFNKADGSTVVLIIDTTNGRLGVGKTPTQPLDVNGQGLFSGAIITSSGNGVQSNKINTYSSNTDLLLTTATAGRIVYTDRVFKAAGYQSSDGSVGATGNFTSADGKTITVKNGLITSIV